MILESSAFKDGAEIPRRHGYKSKNDSTPLTISDVPPNAASLALIMDDPDAMKPAGKIWVHWLMWNIDPATDTIPKNRTPPGSVLGRTDFGENKYGGPAPPDRRHIYVFKLYALDTMLNLQEGSNKRKLEKAMKGHILAEATLRGTYAP